MRKPGGTILANYTARISSSADRRHKAGRKDRGNRLRLCFILFRAFRSAPGDVSVLFFNLRRNSCPRFFGVGRGLQQSEWSRIFAAMGIRCLLRSAGMGRALRPFSDSFRFVRSRIVSRQIRNRQGHACPRQCCPGMFDSNVSSTEPNLLHCSKRSPCRSGHFALQSRTFADSKKFLWKKSQKSDIMISSKEVRFHAVSKEDRPLLRIL